MKFIPKNAWIKTGLLLFINGMLLSGIFHFRTESKYEDAIFGSIVDKIREDAGESQSIDSFFLASMRMAHRLEYSRQTIFSGKRLESLKANFFRPATVDLMTGDGACGSYSTVLARILKAGGYKVRIAHMTVKGQKGGHMVVEAKKNSDNWIVMDPLLLQYFKKPDGSLASFKDVQQNWPYYQKQTSSSYIQDYQYQEAEYTNWNKIPLIGAVIQRTVELVIGKEKAKEISVRSFILRKYNVLYLLTLFAFITCSIFLAYSIYVNRKNFTT